MLELKDAPSAVFDLLAWLEAKGMRQTEGYVLDGFNQSALSRTSGPAYGFSSTAASGPWG